VHEPLLNSSRT